jgi:hypothetical protein
MSSRRPEGQGCIVRFGVSGMFSGGCSGRVLRASSALLVTGLVAALLGSPATAAAAAPPARAAGTVIGELYGVSCASSSSCLAVGTRSGGAGTLTERWNGTKWSVVPSPNLGSGGRQLLGVACASAKSCIAVGSFFAKGTNLPLAERWSGTKWSLLTVPAPAAATKTVLESVACPSASSCQAVGISGDNTLAESWNGSKWSIEPSPSPSTGALNVLSGVACASASDCWAVGYDSAGSLTEQWNGSKWSVVTTPGSTSGGQLIGASCSGKADCLSVGVSSKLLAAGQAWNGSKWATATPKEPAGVATSDLNSVSCPRGPACVAGGTYTGSSGATTLAEGWTGTKWAIQATPSISGSTYASFQGVACTTASNCWAVGENVTSPSGIDPLIEHWNGTAWSVTAS